MLRAGWNSGSSALGGRSEPQPAIEKQQAASAREQKSLRIAPLRQHPPAPSSTRLSRNVAHHLRGRLARSASEGEACCAVARGDRQPPLAFSLGAGGLLAPRAAR